MKLRFLYLNGYRMFNDCQLNFSDGERFRYEDGVLRSTPSDKLPDGFYSLATDAVGHVSGVSMIVGENGTGKTSIATALDEILSDPSTGNFEYILVFEYSSGNDKPELRCMHNLKCGVQIATDVEIRLCADEILELPILAYCSPHYSFQPSVFRERMDDETAGKTIDLSATRYINEAICGEGDAYKRATYGVQRLAALGREETIRAIEFCAAYGETIIDRSTYNVAFPCPDTITISINSDYVVATQHALAVNVIKNSGSPMREWLEQSVGSFEYARVPDLLLQMISILQGEYVTHYATHREFRGVYGYNDRWVEYGLRVTALVSHGGQGDIRAIWDALPFEAADNVRSEAIELLEKMFMDFPEFAARHREIVKLLRRLNRRMYDADSSLERTTAGEEPNMLGEVMSATFKIADDDDRELLYGVLGAFYRSENGKYALDVGFGNLSSGEMSYLALFSRLYAGLKGIDEKNIIIFLDEAETTLHPAWQRKLLYNMIWFVERFLSGKFVHLVFASHSTMLLSDVTKQNVVFLLPKEGGVDRRHIMESCFYELENTFGANVFDLMRLPFGLDDGVMGLWARKKLEALVGEIEKKKRLTGTNIAVARLFGNRFIQGYLSKWYEED